MKISNEEFEKLVQEKLDSEYDRLYKEKFTEAYIITYNMNGGDDEAAAKLADEEATDFAEHMMEVIEEEVREDLMEELE